MTAIDPRFISTSDLQSIFRDDATGLPLSGGIVTFYSDINRNILKPVYQISSNGGDTYQYSPLPNPCTLSMAGTFQDGVGNDIIPYYYPYSGTPQQDSGETELYYITVDNSCFRRQFTREGWPQSTPASGGLNGSFVYNFARNPQFYAWSYLPVGATGFGDVAGQAINYPTLDTADDWLYSIDDHTQTININRGVFVQGTSPVPANPIYYWQYANTGVGSGAATINSVAQRYKSVKTLNGQRVTISFWMQSSVLSFSGNSFAVEIVQAFGSGGTPTPNNVIPVASIGAVANTNWIKYTFTVDIPVITDSQIIGTDGNDHLGLVFKMPLNLPCTIDLANVLFQSGDSASNFPLISNDDQLNSTDNISYHSIFKTGDVKPTLRNKNDEGWLLMDDRLIGSNGSNATHSGWSLFNLYTLIWNNVNSNIWAPIFTSEGVASTYGASAMDDWRDKKQLSLTKVLGRALVGAGQSITTKIVTASNASGNLQINMDNASSLLTGTPFQIGSTETLPGGLSPLVTYYAVHNGPGSILVAASETNAVAAGSGTPGLTLPFSTAGTGVITLILDAINWALGSYVGENTHSLVISEITGHTHPAVFTSLTTKAINTPATNAVYGPGVDYNVNISVGSVGGSQAHNNMQLSSFFNAMIKL